MRLFHWINSKEIVASRYRYVQQNCGNRIRIKSWRTHRWRLQEKSACARHCNGNVESDLFLHCRRFLCHNVNWDAILSPKLLTVEALCDTSCALVCPVVYNGANPALGQMLRDRIAWLSQSLLMIQVI